MIAQTTKSLIDCCDNASALLLATGGGYSFRVVDQLKHRVQDKKFEWDMRKQSKNLVFGFAQKLGRPDEGAELCSVFQSDEFKEQFGQLLPANVAHFLVYHPEQIPVNFLGNCIPFWGTIYHKRNVPVDYVMCLDLMGEVPTTTMMPTGGLFGPKNPTVCWKP